MNLLVRPLSLFSGRLLCGLLAVSVVLQPAFVFAQPPAVTQLPAEPARVDQTLLAAPQAGRLDLTYLTPQTFAAVFVRPREVLTSPALEMLPVEVLSAASLKEVGFDPVNVEELQVLVEPPSIAPGYAAVVRLVEKPDLTALSPKWLAHTQSDVLNGRQYQKSTQPMLPSVYYDGDRTIIAATDAMLRKIVAGRPDTATSPLLEHLANVPAVADIHAVVHLEMIRPLVELALSQVPPIPPEAQPYEALIKQALEAPKKIRAVELMVSLRPGVPSSLTVQANDEAAADQLEQLSEDALAAWRDMMLEASGNLRAAEDPVEQAMGRYVERISGSLVDEFRPSREGETLVLFRSEPTQSSAVTYTATIGILVALLLPAVQAAREAARRTSSINNMKNLMLAMLNYEVANGHYPRQAITDRTGKPLLSWRVAILPYLGEDQLYRQFHLDEPWDSPHNRQLIDRMPPTYQSPNSVHENRTVYLVPAGDGLIMEPNREVRIGDILDGTAKTIALVEADDGQAIIWTKPEDLNVEPKNPLDGLGTMRAGGIFLAAFADGSVRSISTDIDARELWAMFTRGAGD